MGAAQTIYCFLIKSPKLFFICLMLLSGSIDSFSDTTDADQQCEMALKIEMRRLREKLRTDPSYRYIDKYSKGIELDEETIACIKNDADTRMMVRRAMKENGYLATAYQKYKAKESTYPVSEKEMKIRMIKKIEEYLAE